MPTLVVGMHAIELAWPRPEYLRGRGTLNIANSKSRNHLARQPARRNNQPAKHLARGLRDSAESFVRVGTEELRPPCAPAANT